MPRFQEGNDSLTIDRFFALFQSGLNALAELLRFGDREFYTEYVTHVPLLVFGTY